MNILTICRLRTRSTYFLQCLCNYYNLTNHNESYFTIPSLYSCSLQYANTHPIFYKKNYDLWTKYRQKLQEHTLHNFSLGNFGIKLFSKMISSHPIFLYEDQLHKIQIVNNLENTLRFDLYDQIYFLDRNFIDSVASYVYSLSVGKSIYKSADNIKNQPVKFISKIHSSVNSYILDFIIQQKIRTILDNNNFSYRYIDYTDVPKFLEPYKQNNQPNLSVDTKYNYSDLILNYNEMVKYSNNMYNILQKTIAL